MADERAGERVARAREERAGEIRARRGMRGHEREGGGDRRKKLGIE